MGWGGGPHGPARRAGGCGLLRKRTDLHQRKRYSRVSLIYLFLHLLICSFIYLNPVRRKVLFLQHRSHLLAQAPFRALLNADWHSRAGPRPDLAKRARARIPLLTASWKPRWCPLPKVLSLILSPFPLHLCLSLSLPLSHTHTYTRTHTPTTPMLMYFLQVQTSFGRRPL